MKFIIALLLTAILAYFGGIYFPWWTIAVAAFLVPLLIVQPPFRSFLTGFLAVFLLWAYLAWQADNANEGILSERISPLIPGPDNALFLILITGFLGGLLGGLGALTGSLIRRK